MWSPERFCEVREQVVWIISKQLSAGSFRPEEGSLGVAGQWQMEEARGAGNCAAHSRMPLINEIIIFNTAFPLVHNQRKIVNGALSIFVSVEALLYLIPLCPPFFLSSERSQSILPCSYLDF